MLYKQRLLDTASMFIIQRKNQRNSLVNITEFLKTHPLLCTAKQEVFQAEYSKTQLSFIGFKSCI
jgi:hypothetical protein